MVNMMVRNPAEGASLYAKVLNTFFLSTPPVVAHRNRLARLREILIAEVARVVSAGRRARIFNLGCGPAWEVQQFITRDELSAAADLTLLDFSDETVQHTGSVLADLKARHHRGTTVQMIRKNVISLLKEAGKAKSDLNAGTYDLVYCSGLFDYLADSVCHRLMDLCYSLLAPGGLLVATNVSDNNPSRNWMEYAVDWHLIYRNAKQMTVLCPTLATLDDCRIRDELSGVNTFIEIRKPAHA
jgi:extracellular factor (EF) 3-hydroxypalmitic acid methyl ester biosynthesis protein